MTDKPTENTAAANPGHRDFLVRRDLVRVASAANRVHRLHDSNASKWKLRWADHRFRTAINRASRHGSITASALPQLRDHYAALVHAEALAEFVPANPWGDVVGIPRPAENAIRRTR